VVGDLILGDIVNANAANGGADALLEGLPILREADLAIANLESVATAAGQRVPKEDLLAPYYFRARPETLAVLPAAGIDAVATANNHAGDFGRAALVEQGSLLDSMGIAHAGSGPRREEACAPVYLDAGDGLVVALFAADATMPGFAAGEDQAGTCYLDLGDLQAWEDTFSAAVAAAGRQANAVLFAIQWGDDWVAEPSDEKRELGRLLIAMGVDAVLGSNAHVLQGIERRGDGVIIHDSAQVLAPFDRESDSAVMLLELTADGIESLTVEPIVVASDGRGSRMADGEEAERILGRMATLSEALGTDLSSGRLYFEPTGRPAESPPPDAVVTPVTAATGPPPATAPPPGCQVDAIPDDARIDPIDIGPMRLLGVDVASNRYLLPELVEVDLYWTVLEPVEEPVTIIPHGSRAGTELDLWLSEHEPCDWGWPVPRWAVGEIYRDQAALRPPPEALSVAGAATVLSGAGGPLEISVGVAQGGTEVARSETLAQVHMGIPFFALAGIVAVITVMVLGLVLLVRRRRHGLRS
jgi:poly-gamma-glutamate capsule biosynthesis protein CapA/YwtB (metallophosphatase superfamily)